MKPLLYAQYTRILKKLYQWYIIMLGSAVFYIITVFYFVYFKKKKPSTSTWDLVGQRIEIMSLLLNTRGKRGGRQFLNRLFGRFKKNTVLPSDVNALAQWIQSYMQNKSARSCLRNLHWWIWKRGNESQTVKSIQWVIFDFTMRNIIIYFLQRFKKTIEHLLFGTVNTVSTICLAIQ